MAKYRLRSPHVIDNVYYEVGKEVDTNITPTPDMEPLDAEALKRSRSTAPEPGAPGFVVQPWYDSSWKLSDQPKPEESDSKKS